MPLALEEELVGLSLAGDDKAASAGESSLSPRTIKRPTNPVATLLVQSEQCSSSSFEATNGLLGVAAKRPRLSDPPPPKTLPAQLAAPGAAAPTTVIPSPPSLSPLISGGGRFAGSSSSSGAPSNAGSTHASPVPRCSFSTSQPAHEGLAEPRPVAASLGTMHPPWLSAQLSRSQSAPPASTTADDCFDMEVSVTVDTSMPECGSPVALATNCINHSLHLGPPSIGTAGGPTSIGLLPPSLKAAGCDFASASRPTQPPAGHRLFPPSRMDGWGAGRAYSSPGL